LFRFSGSVDKFDVDPPFPCFIEGGRKAGWLGVNDKRIVRFAAVAPVTSGRLWVEVNDEGGKAFLCCLCGKGKGDGCFASAAFLSNQGDGVYGADSKELC